MMSLGVLLLFCSVALVPSISEICIEQRINFGGSGATYSNFGSLYFGLSGLEASRVEINLTALG